MIVDTYFVLSFFLQVFDYEFYGKINSIWCIENAIGSVEYSIADLFHATVSLIC